MPERVFGSSVTKCTRAGRAIAPSCLSTVVHHFLLLCARVLGGRDLRRVLHHRERERHLAFERIGDADHRDLGDVRVRLHRLLDLARAEAMAGDVDHVVGAAEDEVVAVLVADAPVERRVHHAASRKLVK